MFHEAPAIVRQVLNVSQAELSDSGITRRFKQCAIYPARFS